jgi:hypothetical protein
MKIIIVIKRPNSIMTLNRSSLCAGKHGPKCTKFAMGMESKNRRTERSVCPLQREQSRNPTCCLHGSCILPPSHDLEQNLDKDGLRSSHLAIMPMGKWVYAANSFLDLILNANRFVASSHTLGVGVAAQAQNNRGLL